MLFRSYIGSFLPAGERLHVVEVNVRPVLKIHMCAIQSNTMAKPVTKTPCGWEWRHVNGYTLGHLREQAKWPTGAPNTVATQILYLCKEAVLQKETHFKSSDRSVEAICRSSWPIRYCLEISNHTHTHNYYNPAAHVLQGLIISYPFHMRNKTWSNQG